MDSRKNKSVKTTMGEVEINSPRDRDGSFNPQLIPKRSKDVSGIEVPFIFLKPCFMGKDIKGN